MVNDEKSCALLGTFITRADVMKHLLLRHETLASVVDDVTKIRRIRKKRAQNLLFPLILLNFAGSIPLKEKK